MGDPDLQIREGPGHSDPVIRGGGGGGGGRARRFQIFFSVLGASATARGEIIIYSERSDVIKN